MGHPSGLPAETSERYFIFAGRLQPPHNGHIDVVRFALLECMTPLYIGLIVSAASAEGERGPHADIADRHNQPTKNPFSFHQRRLMLDQTLRESGLHPGTDRLGILALPRPSLAWAWTEAMLPGHRTWIVPDCGDHFDDEKAAFYREMGDEVVRPSFEPTIRGTRVRELIRRRDERVESFLPKPVVRALRYANTLDAG